MIEINNTTKHKINISQITALTERFLKTYKLSQTEVSLAIVGPNRMRNLNRDFRGIDKTTDVLSFPASASSADKLGRAYLGEIIINPVEASRVSKYRDMLIELNMPPFQEREDAQQYIFNFLLVHGLLHLVGYDDHDQKERLEMLTLGRDFLKKML